MRGRGAAAGGGPGGHGDAPERALRRRLGGRRGGGTDPGGDAQCGRPPGGAALRVDRRLRPLPAGAHRAGGGRRGRGRPGRPPPAGGRGAGRRRDRPRTTAAEGRTGALQRLLGDRRRCGAGARPRPPPAGVGAVGGGTLDGGLPGQPDTDRPARRRRPAGARSGVGGVRPSGAAGGRCAGGSRRRQAPPGPDQLPLRGAAARSVARRLRPARGRRRAGAERCVR